MDAERRVLIGGAVAFGADRIVAVGASSELRAAHPDAEIVDVTGCVVTPGMINAHQHLTGDPLVRSCIPDLLPPGVSIFEWSVPVHAAHEPDDDEVSAVLSAVGGAVGNGVTTVVEAGTVAASRAGRRRPASARAPSHARRVGLGHRGGPVHGAGRRGARPPARRARRLSRRWAGRGVGDAGRPRSGVGRAAGRCRRPRTRAAARA